MGIIHKENYFTVPHDLVEFDARQDGYCFPLLLLKGSALMLYFVLSHFANRFHKNVPTEPIEGGGALNEASEPGQQVMDDSKARSSPGLGVKFWMTDKRLHEITGLSLRQLCRARVTLKELGLIRTWKRTGLALDYEILPLDSRWRKRMTRMASGSDKEGITI